jgi:hypothetical protein
MSGDGGNLGNAHCSGLPVEGIDSDVIHAPKTDASNHAVTDFVGP